MLELKKINAYYGESHILRDVTFTVSDGRSRLLDGPKRRRKNDDAKSDHRAAASPFGRHGFDGKMSRRCPPTEGPAAAWPSCPKVARSFLISPCEKICNWDFWARSDSPCAAAEKAAFDEVYHLFPKLTQILHRPGGVLSGGEQQQLAIGRALVRPIRNCSCWMSRRKASSLRSWIRSKT